MISSKSKIDCIFTKKLLTLNTLMIMRKMKNLMIAIVVAMPVFLCGCPGDNCVDENDPKGYVVKMKNDYTDKVLVRMFVHNEGDTSFCCASIKDHTVKIVDDYYRLNCYPYYIAAYTSINSDDWDESLLDSISKYVIDKDPFEEVYVCHHDYDIDALKAFIENNSLNKLERLK